MRVPEDRPAVVVGLSPGGVWRSPRRHRPSGQSPPLPHRLHTTGVGWLIWAVLLVVVSLLVFSGELRGPAVAVTAVDDAVVRRLAGLLQVNAFRIRQRFAARAEP
jgi:hypothetical protein